MIREEAGSQICQLLASIENPGYVLTQKNAPFCCHDQS